MSTPASFGNMNSEQLDPMHIVYDCLTHMTANPFHNLEFLTRCNVWVTSCNMRIQEQCMGWYYLTHDIFAIFD